MRQKVGSGLVPVDQTDRTVDETHLGTRKSSDTSNTTCAGRGHLRFFRFSRVSVFRCPSDWPSAARCCWCWVITGREENTSENPRRSSNTSCTIREKRISTYPLVMVFHRFFFFYDFVVLTRLSHDVFQYLVLEFSEPATGRWAPVLNRLIDKRPWYLRFKILLVIASHQKSNIPHPSSLVSWVRRCTHIIKTTEQLILCSRRILEGLQLSIFYSNIDNTKTFWFQFLFFIRSISVAYIM